MNLGICDKISHLKDRVTISTSITQKPSNIESIKQHQSNAVENLESIPTAFEEYKKDFLSAEAANDLRAFLEQESYSKDGSR